MGKLYRKISCIFLLIIYSTVLIFFGGCGKAELERHNKPENVTAVSTEDSITVSKVDGAQYCLGEGGLWQDSNIFSDLLPDTEYKVFVRIKATENKLASESVMITVKTKMREENNLYRPEDLMWNNFEEEEWQALGDIGNKNYGDILQAEIVGKDYIVQSPKLAVDSSKITTVETSIMYNAQSTQSKLQWITEGDKQYDDNKSVLVDEDSYIVYRIPLNELTDWSGSIKQFGLFFQYPNIQTTGQQDILDVVYIDYIKFYNTNDDKILQYNFNESLEGFTMFGNTNDTEYMPLEQAGGCASFSAKKSPTFLSPEVDFNASDFDTVEIAMKNTIYEGRNCYFKFRKDDESVLNSGKYILMQFDRRCYVKQTFDLKDHPLWKDTITGLRLIPAVGSNCGNFKIEYIKLFGTNYSLTFPEEGNDYGFKINGTPCKAYNGELTFKNFSSNSILVNDNVQIDASNNKKLVIEYPSASALSFYYGDSKEVKMNKHSEGVFSYDFSEEQAWTGIISQIKLKPVAEKLDLKYIKFYDEKISFDEIFDNVFAQNISKKVTSSGTYIDLSDKVLNSFNNQLVLTIQNTANLKGNLFLGNKSGDYKNIDFFISPNAQFKDFKLLLDCYREYVGEFTDIKLMLTALDKSEDEVQIKSLKFVHKTLPDRITLDNGTLQVGVNLQWGGVIDYISDPTYKENKNLVNRGEGGRVVQLATYGHQYPDITQFGDAWWWNGIQAGDNHNNPSKIMDYEFDGKSSVKVVLRAADWDNGVREALTEDVMVWGVSFVEDNPRLIKIDMENYYYSKEENPLQIQEIPAVFPIIDFDTFYNYNGDKPFTGDSLYTESPSTHEIKFMNSTESWACWADTSRPDKFGFGVYNQDSIGIRYYSWPSNEFYPGVPGEIYERESEYSVATQYLSMWKYARIERFVPLKTTSYLYIGALEDMRESFNGLYKDADVQKKTTFDFSNKEGVQGWHAASAINSSTFGFNRGLNIDIIDNDAMIMNSNAEVDFNANDFSSLKITLINNSNCNSLGFQWITSKSINALTPHFREDQKLSLAIIPNNAEEKTYIIDLNHINWKDKIVALGLVFSGADEGNIVIKKIEFCQ